MGLHGTLTSWDKGKIFDRFVFGDAGGGGVRACECV